jgi:glycine/D-amino acid oxidase-like deaminating enzyme
VQTPGRAARDANPPKPAKSLGKKVAIIGGGPAGMNAAWQLAKAGVEAHIFERDQQLGGKLGQVIPWERLPKAIGTRRSSDSSPWNIKATSWRDLRSSPVGVVACYCGRGPTAADHSFPGHERVIRPGL